MTDHLQPSRPTTRPLLALILLAGAIATAVLGAWVRHLTFSEGMFILREDQTVLGTLTHWQVGLVMLGVVTSLPAVAYLLVRDSQLQSALGWAWSWIKHHPWWSLVLLIGMMLGAVDGYEFLYDPYRKQWGPYPYRIRDDLQNWLWFGSALLGGLGLMNLTGGNLSGWLAGCDQKITEKRHGLAWIKVVVTPVLLAAVMCWFALGGIPHFSDALTYLMQGRILYTGSLWLPSPAHPELFIHSLFFLDTDGRFYGKYPIGWPTIVGTFDHLNLLFLANATLSGLAALLTGLVARELAGKRVAIYAALVFGLSPWIWFHGASFASHVASTCAVWGFLWLFLVSWRKGKWSSGVDVKWSSGQVAKWPSEESDLKSPSPSPSPRGRGGKSIHHWYRGLVWALGAGLVLGCAVLIRPGDATNFALPAIVMVLIGLVRAPKKWLPIGVLISVGAMVGVLIYLWSNAQTTGDAFTSPYKLEPRWKEDWQPTLASMAGRFAFQWVELTSRFPGWGLGGMTLSLMGLFTVFQHWREPTIRRGAWVMVLSAVGVFFVFNTTFGFTNVWWGPRWLLPVAPLMAILIGVLANEVFEVLKPMHGHARALVVSKPLPTYAASLLLAIILAGMVLVGPTAYLTKFWEVKTMPPHGVTHKIHQRVMEMGLGNAVVGMSTAGGLIPPDARSGMVMMTVPFEANPVIYVRTIPSWQTKALAAYPGRQLYEVSTDPNDVNNFVIKQLTPNEQ